MKLFLQSFFHPLEVKKHDQTLEKCIKWLPATNKLALSLGRHEVCMKGGATTGVVSKIYNEPTLRLHITVVGYEKKSKKEKRKTIGKEKKQGKKTGGCVQGQRACRTGPFNTD